MGVDKDDQAGEEAPAPSPAQLRNVKESALHLSTHQSPVVQVYLACTTLTQWHGGNMTDGRKGTLLREMWPRADGWPIFSVILLRVMV